MNDEDKGLTPADYQSALEVQSACNLSGVVRTFAEIMPRIWAEARRQGKGTDWVNHHPISRLFAAQVAYLAGVGMHMHGGNDYGAAYDECKAGAKT